MMKRTATELALLEQLGMIPSLNLHKLSSDRLKGRLRLLDERRETLRLVTRRYARYLDTLGSE